MKINFIFLKYLIVVFVFLSISVNANAQAVAEQIATETDTQNVITTATDNSNRIYSAAEVGDYRNYCEYGDSPFFLADGSKQYVKILNGKASTSNIILGCFPVSYNSNGIFYNLIKMDLLAGVTQCPAINLTEAFPTGTPTPIYNYMDMTPQSYYHRSAATQYLPRMSLALSKGNSCYYYFGSDFYQNQNDKKEYMAYFFVDVNQYKDFVKGIKYYE